MNMAIPEQDGKTEKEISSSRNVVVLFALVSIGLTMAWAKLGFLPGPIFLDPSSGVVVPYTNSYVQQDIGVTVLTAVLGYALVKGITKAFEAGFLSSQDSRKLIHTLSAPLYMLFWPLFSPAQGSQAFAALVPMINGIRLILASRGEGETTLAKAVSRSGDLKEALEGPFIYVCIMFLCILSFWRSSAVGLVALSTMAVGDGLADIIGRRYGKSNQWPGLKKSVVGSIAFSIGSTLAIVGILQWMQYWNCLSLATSVTDLWIRAAIIGFVASAIELLPFGNDNYSVPAASAVLALILFPLPS